MTMKLEAVSQANSSDGKDEPEDDAGANVCGCAKPFAIFEHFGGFPTETGKRSVTSEESDGDGDTPVRRNDHAIQRELADQTEEETAGEIDKQRSIGKRCAHADLHNTLQAVASKSSDGTEKSNQEDFQSSPLTESVGC